MAYTFTRSAPDAEEAVQDAFLKAYSSLPRFRRGAPFRPWLSKIVVNEARSRCRTARRHERISRAVAGQVGFACTVAPSVEATAVAAHDRRELAAAVERLTVKLRDVVYCRYFVGLSEEETAAALSIPTGTVKSRLSRALENLEAQLQAAPEDTSSRHGPEEDAAVFASPAAPYATTVLK